MKLEQILKYFQDNRKNKTLCKNKDNLACAPIVKISTTRTFIQFNSDLAKNSTPKMYTVVLSNESSLPQRNSRFIDSEFATVSILFIRQLIFIDYTVRIK